MTERPILFSGPMVKAILDGRKTQTRRIMKPEPLYEGLPVKQVSPLLGRDGHKTGEFMIHHPEYDRVVRSGLWCPYGRPGDRLWVREQFCKYGSGYIFRADYGGDLTPISDGIGGPWKPSIHMPREACRLILEITDVRVQRLQDLTEEDAKAEGAEREYDEPYESWAHLEATSGYFSPSSYASGFERLWDSINANRAPWAGNPWVWAVTFRRVEAGQRKPLEHAEAEGCGAQTSETGVTG